MRPIEVIGVAVSDGLRTNTLPVQIAEVVPIHISIGGCFPVAALGRQAIAMTIEVVEIQNVERRCHIAKPCVDVDRKARRENGEDGS